MKLIRENIDEAIKHLQGRSNQDVSKNISILFSNLEKYGTVEDDINFYDNTNVENWRSNKIWVSALKKMTELIGCRTRDIVVVDYNANNYSDFDQFFNEIVVHSNKRVNVHAGSWGSLHVFPDVGIAHLDSNNLIAPMWFFEKDFVLEELGRFILYFSKGKKLTENIKHLKPRSNKELQKYSSKEVISDFISKFESYTFQSLKNMNTIEQDKWIESFLQYITDRYKIRGTKQEVLDALFVNEAYDWQKTHLQIFKNNDQKGYYNYIILKGNDLYNARVIKGEKLKWKFISEIDKNKYIINGTIVHNPHIKLIVIFQNKLKKP